MTNPELISLAKRMATDFDIDPVVFCALVETESNWNSWAARYEPGFKKRYIDPIESIERWAPTSYATEREHRSTSFGLCQVMGQVARELGFTGVSLTELCDPRTGLYYGARRLKKALDRKHGDVSAALLDYNGGSDKEYPARVLAKVGNYA